MARYTGMFNDLIASIYGGNSWGIIARNISIVNTEDIRITIYMQVLPDNHLEKYDMFLNFQV